MITHNRIDDAQKCEVESSTSTSTGVTSTGYIDLYQNGGVDEENLILSWDDAADQALTIDIMTCDTLTGTYASVHTVTTTASTADKVQIRVPLACKRYLKLKVTTGATAPTDAGSAVLRLAV